MIKRHIIAALCIIFIGTSVATADETSARKSLMRATGAAAGVGGPILKGGEFDAKAAGLAAATMAAVGDAFPLLFSVDNSSDANTEAGAKIWSDNDGFNAIAMKMAKAGSDASAAVRAGDEDAFKQAFGQALSTCKECHTAYRVKK